MTRYLLNVCSLALLLPLAAAAQQPSPLTLPDVISRARSGQYGNIDELFVMRDGKTIAHEKFNLNYVEISRGKRIEIGCGTDACSGWTHGDEFNYFNPTTHPFYRGRPVHTLQSVTKSVTSAVIGAAMQQGKIGPVTTPLLSYFSEYDLSQVDERHLPEGPLGRDPGRAHGILPRRSPDRHQGLLPDRQ